MASSSEELSAQAEQLKELISFFKFSRLQNKNTSFSKKISPKLKSMTKKPVTSVPKKPLIIDMSDDSDKDSGFERY